MTSITASFHFIFILRQRIISYRSLTQFLILLYDFVHNFRNNFKYSIFLCYFSLRIHSETEREGWYTIKENMFLVEFFVIKEADLFFTAKLLFLFVTKTKPSTLSWSLFKCTVLKYSLIILLHNCFFYLSLRLVNGKRFLPVVRRMLEESEQLISSKRYQ